MHRRSLLSLLLLAAFTVAAPCAPARPRAVGISALAVRPDGDLLAVGDAEGAIHLLTLPALREERVLKGHTDGVTSLAFSRDGKTLCSGALDRTARVWSVASGALTATLGPHSDDVLCVALSPDGGMLLASAYDGVTVRWDLTSKTRREGKAIGHTAAFSPDGRRFATASIDGTLRLYAADGHEIASWKGHRLCPNTVAFSPDGHRLASCVDHVKVWNVDTHAQVSDIATDLGSTLLSARWSPDGHQVVATSLWGGAALFTDSGGRWARAPVLPGTRWQQAAFRPSAGGLVVGSLDGAVSLTDPSGRRRLSTWKNPPARVVR